MLAGGGRLRDLRASISFGFRKSLVGHAAPYKSLKHEEDRGKQDEIGDQMGKGIFTPVCQEKTPEPAPEQTHRNEGGKPRAHLPDILTEAVETPRSAHYQRQCARRIGHHRRDAKKNEDRKSDQRPATSHGINHACGTGCAEKGDDFDG